MGVGHRHFSRQRSYFEDDVEEVLAENSPTADAERTDAECTGAERTDDNCAVAVDVWDVSGIRVQSSRGFTVLSPSLSFLSSLYLYMYM